MGHKGSKEKKKKGKLNPVEILKGTPVSVLLGDQEVVKVSDTDTLGSALSILSSAGYLSAPIHSEESGSDEAFLDVLSAAAYLAKQRSEGKTFDDALKSSLRDVVGEIGPGMHHHKVRADDSLQSVANRMFELGMYRLGIYDEHGCVVKIVTQSLFVSWIWSNLEDLHPNPDASLEELGLARKLVKTVDLADVASDAFYKIYRAGISAMGVVNHLGELYGALSASELRTLDPDSVDDLNLTVKDFMDARSVKGVNFCAPDASLKECLLNMVDNRLHRIFVVDPGTSKPVGIVTLTDIIGLMKSQDSWVYAMGAGLSGHV